MPRTLRFLFFLMLFAPLSLVGQVKLKIVVNGLKSSTGSVLLDFRDANDHRICGLSEKITDQECILMLEGLETGQYAFRYFHDENENDKLDTSWLGIPKEGYGFSNSRKGRFGPPKFKHTVFAVNQDTTIVCTPHYIKF